MIWKVMPEDMILYTNVSYLPPAKYKVMPGPTLLMMKFLSASMLLHKEKPYVTALQISRVEYA
jgi:hypothetical protein